jgi:tetratricopeptide (TPR) repeat protein
VISRLNSKKQVIAGESRSGFSQTFPICLLLVIATLAAYWQLGSHDFIGFDDQHYVVQNYHVKAGLTAQGLAWAFTDGSTGTWHPLTWLSLMFDGQLFGLNPRAFHFTSLFFHGANTLLLFAVLFQMTGARLKSGFVAALFALHPLHVESVAWIAERKDVLSTFFWFLTMWAYVRYVERGMRKWYALALLFFVLGLLSKPMLVTLPFILLLLDYWPLARARKNPKLLISRLFLEKIPFFVLTVVSCGLAFFFQQAVGATTFGERLPFWVRTENALISYVSYIGKLFWPLNLAILYPYTDKQLIWGALSAGVFLILVTLFVIHLSRRQRRKMPWLAVGWFWYLGTLVPVIGFVQIGSQAMADRYTYVPFIGLFILLTWGVSSLFEKHGTGRKILSVTGVAVVSGLMILTWFQTQYWQNNITVFEHTLQVTGENAVVEELLGSSLVQQGKTEQAIGHYLNALRINPGNPEAHYNLGVALASEGKNSEAYDHYLEALKLKPDFAPAYNRLGVAVAAQGKTADAVSYYFQALSINPEYSEAHYNLGVALMTQGKTADAIVQYGDALKADPDYLEAHDNLGTAFFFQGKLRDAITQYKEALRIQPNSAKVRYNLGTALLRQGETQEAIRSFIEALRIQPDYADAHRNLGVAYVTIGNKDAAMAEYAALEKLNPELAKILLGKIQEIH